MNACHYVLHLLPVLELFRISHVNICLNFSLGFSSRNGCIKTADGIVFQDVEETDVAEIFDRYGILADAYGSMIDPKGADGTTELTYFTSYLYWSYSV